MKRSSYNQKRLGFGYCKMLLAVLVYSGGAIVPTDWQQAYAGGTYINIPGDNYGPGGNNPPASGSGPSSPSVPGTSPSVGRPALPGGDPKYGGSLDHGGSPISSPGAARPVSPPTAGQPPGFRPVINPPAPITYPPGAIGTPVGGTVTPIVTNPTNPTSPTNSLRPPLPPGASPVLPAAGIALAVGQMAAAVMGIVSGEYDIETKKIQCQSASAGFMMIASLYRYDGSVSPPKEASAPPLGDCNAYTAFLGKCPSTPNDAYGARVPNMTSLCGLRRP